MHSLFNWYCARRRSVFEKETKKIGKIDENKTLNHYFNCGALLCLPSGRVDLSKYTNLTDRKDDAGAFIRAINDAGDGGMVYIPAGTVILEQPVQIKNQSLTIVGDGLSVTKIEPVFSNGKSALSFISDSTRKTSCRWLLSDFLLGAGKANVGAALQLTDQRGVKGGTHMKISNVLFHSYTRNYFERGIIVDGMAKVDIETSNFVGELQYSRGERGPFNAKPHYTARSSHR